MGNPPRHPSLYGMGAHSFAAQFLILIMIKFVFHSKLESGTSSKFVEMRATHHSPIHNHYHGSLPKDKPAANGNEKVKYLLRKIASKDSQLRFANHLLKKIPLNSKSSRAMKLLLKHLPLRRLHQTVHLVVTGPGGRLLRHLAISRQLIRNAPIPPPLRQWPRLGR